MIYVEGVVRLPIIVSIGKQVVLGEKLEGYATIGIAHTIDYITGPYRPRCKIR